MSRALVAFSRPFRRLIVLVGRQLLTHTPGEHSHFQGMAIWRRLAAQCEARGRWLGQQEVQLQGRSYLCQVFQAVPGRQGVQQEVTDVPAGTNGGGSGGVGGGGGAPAGRMPPPRAVHTPYGDAWNGGTCGVRGAAVAAVGCGLGGGMGRGAVQSGRAGLGMGLGLRREVRGGAGGQGAGGGGGWRRVGRAGGGRGVRGAGVGGARGSRGVRGVVRVVG